MAAAEFVLFTLIAVATLVTLAQRVRVAYPIFLVIGGIAAGLVPGMPRITIDPQVVYLLVLPPLVYIAAFFTPLRTLRANYRTVASLAVGLVIASALMAAVVAHALVPGMSWVVALLLGAIVSPTDEVAVTQVLRLYVVPRRVLSILDGESLLNDATGLALYRVAVLAVLAGSFSFVSALNTFVTSAAGGILIGLIVGWFIGQVRRRLRDTSVELTVTLLTPYAAFLPAEALHLSGVIAAVVAGMFLGPQLSRISNADVRISGRAVWETLVFLLNGVVFFLTGLEVSYVIGRFAMSDIWTLIVIGVAVTFALLVVRALWIFGTTYLPHWWKRRRAAPRLLGESVVVSWAGMRGVVSLAAVLATPQALPLATRGQLLVITLTVIVLTLVGPGLTLPWVLRRVELGPDSEVREEEAEARRRMVDAAVRRIDELYPVWPTHHPLLNELRQRYRHRTEDAERRHSGSQDEADRDLIEHREIRRSVAEAERSTLLRLQAEGRIDFDVVRKLERELDLEEQRDEA